MLYYYYRAAGITQFGIVKLTQTRLAILTAGKRGANPRSAIRDKGKRWASGVSTSKNGRGDGKETRKLSDPPNVGGRTGRGRNDAVKFFDKSIRG